MSIQVEKTKRNLIIRGPHRAVILVSRSSIPQCKYGNPSYHPVLLRHYRDLESYPFQPPKTSKSDRCFVTAPPILPFIFYCNWYSPPAVSTLENSDKQTYINLLIHQITTPLITEIHQETPVDRKQVKR